MQIVLVGVIHVAVQPHVPSVRTVTISMRMVLALVGLFNYSVIRNNVTI